MAGTFPAFPFDWEVDSGTLVPCQGRRQDWRLTSSGVGLNYSPPLPFPPPYARSTIHEPLPPASEKVWRDEVIPRLATTTELAYGPKTHGGVLGHPRYSVSAPHWDVHYNKDLREKLKLRAWRFPLTMRNQKSEMRDRYPGWPNLPQEPTFHAGPQPFGLAAHHADGASKSILASTQNKELAGKTFYVRDKAVLQLNEPYMSVTTRDFRAFTEKELQGYPRRDAFMFRQCEDYPLICDPGPMRDIIQFPKATRVPRLGPNTPPVPHRGLLTLAQESYQPPNDSKRTWDRFCPVEQPPMVSCRVPVVEILCIPHMYETEYKCYGSGKPMPV
ncbi:stabilizer of axonemal microtubules 3 [Rhineura floridana]|uniref:stabilizer of axonemal microtubules 3 n=1 Tax=Rhineura floridana TaxID=261503 RepID=UPI002AC828E8|nr:stabilizer of axonemal microtubules 3 [Rhineura floridana]